MCTRCGGTGEHRNGRKLVRELCSWETANNYRVGALVRECYNCAEAEVDDDGDIWIANPQIGHWLSDEELIEFAAWASRQ